MPSRTPRCRASGWSPEAIPPGPAGIVRIELFRAREKFVQWWIEQAHRDRPAGHRIEDAAESSPEAAQAIDAGTPSLSWPRDHVRIRGCRSPRNMLLGAAQADALRSNSTAFAASSGVSVSAHTQHAQLIRPPEDGPELLGHLRLTSARHRSDVAVEPLIATMSPSRSTIAPTRTSRCFHIDLQADAPVTGPPSATTRPRERPSPLAVRIPCAA